MVSHSFPDSSSVSLQFFLIGIQSGEGTGITALVPHSMQRQTGTVSLRSKANPGKMRPSIRPESGAVFLIFAPSQNQTDIPGQKKAETGIIPAVFPEPPPDGYKGYFSGGAPSGNGDSSNNRQAGLPGLSGWR